MAGTNTRGKKRIMYIEHKGIDGIEGSRKICWVEISKTGRSFHYEGKTLGKVKGGFKHNCIDEETGDLYWVSGPKKNGGDQLYGRGVVEIDPDAREEYWMNIRKKPENINHSKYQS